MMSDADVKLKWKVASQGRSFQIWRRPEPLGIVVHFCLVTHRLLPSPTLHRRMFVALPNPWTCKNVCRNMLPALNLPSGTLSLLFADRDYPL